MSSSVSLAACFPCFHTRVDQQAAARAAQGVNGAQYGSTVRLDTRIQVDSNSTDCVPAEGDDDMGRCAPMGGYSVWASMPPQSNSTGAARKQLLVLSHWDSQGLFRSIISVRPHSSCCHACSLGSALHVFLACLQSAHVKSLCA